MPGRRGTIVFACAAALAVAGVVPAGAVAQTTTQTATTQAPAATTQAPAATTQAAPTTQAPAATTQAAPTTQPPAATTQAAPTTQAPAAGNGRSVPIALIVLGAVLLAALALVGFARWWAWEPMWLVRWRHSTAEAGWRASAAWAEFTDWLRLGR
jgi:hypothetical protein